MTELLPLTLVPSGSGEWWRCKVLNVKPNVRHFIFVLYLMWTWLFNGTVTETFSMYASWKCMLYLKTWPVYRGGLTAKERSDCARAVFFLSSVWMSNRYKCKSPPPFYVSFHNHAFSRYLFHYFYMPFEGKKKIKCWCWFNWCLLEIVLKIFLIFRQFRVG